MHITCTRIPFTGSSMKPGPELNIFSAGSSNPTLNTHAYINHNGNGAKPGSVSSNGYQTNGYQTKNNNNNYNSDYGSSNGGLGGGGGNGSPNGGGNGQNGNNGGGSNSNNPAIIDPHYVFGAPQSVPILPNLPIFPYNSPTVAPAFQQFPQPNHPGSVLNPGRPQNGMQPLNPYNSPFVFGQQPFYNSPGGTGGPPGGSSGILGGSGGGLAPYPGGYPSPNSYNKPPPQYQNQNPYNRQTQSHAHSGGSSNATYGSISAGICKLAMTITVVGMMMRKMLQIST
ncbi:uncharacterized protein LOC142229572 [Haematobia irritans]|uniref:uncharacterized protein LOC142229572 n=1 Tax=Haematobia irritans TaxID=7368 RepID=UPI003F4F6842